jgi:hypothetical protein
LRTDSSIELDVRLQKADPAKMEDGARH